MLIFRGFFYIFILLLDLIICLLIIFNFIFILFKLTEIFKKY